MYLDTSRFKGCRTGKPRFVLLHVTCRNCYAYCPCNCLHLLGSLGVVVERCANMVPSSKQRRHIGLQARQHHLHCNFRISSRSSQLTAMRSSNKYSVLKRFEQSKKTSQRPWILCAEAQQLRVPSHSGRLREASFARHQYMIALVCRHVTLRQRLSCHAVAVLLARQGHKR